MDQSKLTVSRRTFAKLSAVAAVGAMASAHVGGALAESAVGDTEPEVKRVRSMCRCCGKMECPIWVTVKDGRVVDIIGDEDSITSRGNLCAKGKSGMQQLYHPDRVRYPMKRTNPKGEDAGWVRISWDEAIQGGAQALNELIEKYGPHTVKIMHGTSRLSTYAICVMDSVIGTSNLGCTAGQICKGPREAAAAMVAYNGCHWVNLNDQPKIFFQWGSNTEVSNYDNAARVTVDAQVKAGTSIVVGPRLQNLGKECEHWVNLRPGTDDFVALAMLEVVLNEMGNFDSTFVKRWTNGPFLYCADIEPSGFTHEAKYENGSYPLEIKTRLLKESDLVEGGSPRRFMVWDQAAGKLTYYDTESCLWENEGEDEWKPTEAVRVNETGMLPIDNGIPNGIDPALEGTFEVTLKNGTTATVTPVMQLFKEFLADYTPEAVADITWVEPQVIREAAQAYGAECGQGGIQYQLAIDHAANVIQTSRAILSLSALLGNLDTPAGNRGGQLQSYIYNNYFMYAAPFGGAGIKKEELDKMAGADKFPLLPWISRTGGAAMTHDMTSSTDMILTGDPYPIRAMISDTGSHFHSGNATANWEAYKTLDFYWCSELWFTPTAELADIIVPATHYLETNCLRDSQGAECGLGVQVRVVEPLGEARWDSAAIVELAGAMGYNWWPASKEAAPPFWPEEWLEHPVPTEDLMLEMSVLPMKLDMGMPGPDGKTLHVEGWQDFVDQFQEHGQWDLKEITPYGYYRRYMYGLLRPDGKQGFLTPTGKFEIFSTILESYHPGEEWPVAREPFESPYSTPEVAEEYPIIFTSGRRIPVFFHSEGRQVPYTREQCCVPTFQINPETAAELGIENGDWCWIESRRGKVRLVADLFHGIAPGVIEADHGWWFPELPGPEHGWDLSNVNVLVDQYNQDPIFGSTALRAYLVKVYKATPENCPDGRVIPCSPDGTQIITSPDDPRLKEWMPVYDQGKE